MFARNGARTAGQDAGDAYISLPGSTLHDLSEKSVTGFRETSPLDHPPSLHAFCTHVDAGVTVPAPSEQGTHTLNGAMPEHPHWVTRQLVFESLDRKSGPRGIAINVCRCDRRVIVFVVPVTMPPQ